MISSKQRGGFARSLALVVALALPFIGSSIASAGPVRGVIRLPKGYKLKKQLEVKTFWGRMPNQVLPIAPPLVDPRRWMVVAIEGSGLPDKSGIVPTIVMEDARFIPPVLAVRPGTKVTFTNKDWMLHLLEPTSSKTPKPQTLTPGDSFEHTFAEEGQHQFRCSENSHMRVTVLVTKEAQLALPDDSGTFRFPAIPNGTYAMKVWYGGKWIHKQPLTVRGHTVVDIKLAGVEK